MAVFNAVIGLSGRSAAKAGAVASAGSFSDLTPDKISRFARMISDNSEITKETRGVIINDNGEMYTLYVGDKIDIAVNGEVHPFCIAGFNHDDLTDAASYGSATATGKAGITLFNQQHGAVPLKVHESETAVTWKTCKLRSNLQSTIKGQLPAEWQKIIQPVNKPFGTSASKISICSDTLFLLSEYEALGILKNALVEEGEQYKLGKLSLTKFIGFSSAFWSRSKTASSYSFCLMRMDTTLGWSQTSSNASCFAFCV